MSDIKCPECGREQEIDHDDGYGYEEGVRHEQECYCGYVFVFTTAIMFHYEAFKAPCLNGGEHDYQPTSTEPKWHTKMMCEYCGDKREPADEEKTQHGIPPIPEHYLR